MSHMSHMRMMKSCLVLLALACLLGHGAGLAQTSSAKAGAPLAVDNFEEQNRARLFSAVWVAYTDKAVGGKSAAARLIISAATSAPIGVAAPDPTTAESGEQERAPRRFDELVRADFFAGLAGNREAFDRAMKVCEDALAKDPKHAEAMVWHGAGVIYLSLQASEAGDKPRAIELWDRGLKEMDEAVALWPGHLGVIIPRGATLLEASRHAPDPALAKALLTKAVDDYEKALEVQKPFFHRLSVHSRGELLFGLAEGYHRLGEMRQTQHYFQRIVKECEGSGYAKKARAWLEKKALPNNHSALSCSGCHAR